MILIVVHDSINNRNNKNLVGKAAISGISNNGDLDKNLATKAELKAEQNKKQNHKHLIQLIFEVKVILKKVVLKIV